MIKRLITIATFVSLTLALYPQGGAATPATKAQVNSIFESCLVDPPQTVSPSAMTSLCACYAAGLMATMSAEDLSLLTSSAASPEGQKLRNKILTEIYAPCAAEIIYETIEQSCLEDTDVQSLNDTYDTADICTCSAQQADTWFKTRNQSLMTDILEKQTQSTHPLKALLSHQLLVSTVKSNIVACTAEFQ